MIARSTQSVYQQYIYIYVYTKCGLDYNILFAPQIKQNPLFSNTEKEDRMHETQNKYTAVSEDALPNPERDTIYLRLPV